AHNLGLEIVAEGVETPAQAAFLLKEQCEEAQGYLYAKPLPAADFEVYLRTRHLSLNEPAAQDRIGPRTQFRRQARRAPCRRRRSSGRLLSASSSLRKPISGVGKSAGPARKSCQP